MKEIRNSEQLQRWLLESGHLGRLWDRPRFVFDEEEFKRELAGVSEQYPGFVTQEAEARAALRLLGKQEANERLRQAPDAGLNPPQADGATLRAARPPRVERRQPAGTQ